MSSQSAKWKDVARSQTKWCVAAVVVLLTLGLLFPSLGAVSHKQFVLRDKVLLQL